MTTITVLKERLGVCKALIEKEYKLRPKSPGKGQKPPPPSRGAIEEAKHLQTAASALDAALRPALREYDDLVKSRKEQVHEALLLAVKPFFGTELDTLAHRQLEMMHFPVRDGLNAAFSRIFSPPYHDPDRAPEALVSIVELHLAHIEKWSESFGWKAQLGL